MARKGSRRGRTTGKKTFKALEAEDRTVHVTPLRLALIQAFQAADGLTERRGVYVPMVRLAQQPGRRG